MLTGGNALDISRLNDEIVMGAICEDRRKMEENHARLMANLDEERRRERIKEILKWAKIRKQDL